MQCFTLKSFFLLLIESIVLFNLANATIPDDLAAAHYRASPKLTGPAKFVHPAEPLLDQLDVALEKISTVYMQALFSGTHTAALDLRMRGLEIELFDLLDALYKENRMADYMKYEAEVTRQMILYNMLKKLFGYAAEDNERIK